MDVLRGVVKIFDIQRGLGKNYFSSEGGVNDFRICSMIPLLINNDRSLIEESHPKDGNTTPYYFSGHSCLTEKKINVCVLLRHAM